MNSNDKNINSRTGAIFCGGQSRRMGQPKAGVLLHDGKTLIEHVYNVLKIFCHEVVLVGHGQGVPESMKSLIRVEDNFKDCGPLGALEALLSSQINSEYIVLPCDVCQINEEVLDLLINSRAKRPVVITYNQTLEPLIGCYSSEILLTVRQQIKASQLSMKVLLNKVGYSAVELPEDKKKCIRNVNYMEDIQ